MFKSFSVVVGLELVVGNMWKNGAAGAGHRLVAGHLALWTWHWPLTGRHWAHVTKFRRTSHEEKTHSHERQEEGLK